MFSCLIQLAKRVLFLGIGKIPLAKLIPAHPVDCIPKAHPELRWSVVEQEFADEDEVKEWIIKNALGTRNLTQADWMMLMGALYKMRKKKHGGTGANQHTRLESAQNGHIPNDEPTRISEQIAKELGVGKETVKRAERFVDGLEAADKVVPGFKEDVLTGKVKVQKGEVAELRRQNPEEIKKSVEAIKDRKGKPRTRPFSAPVHELRGKEIFSCAGEYRDTTQMKSAETPTEYRVPALRIKNANSGYI